MNSTNAWQMNTNRFSHLKTFLTKLMSTQAAWNICNWNAEKFWRCQKHKSGLIPLSTSIQRIAHKLSVYADKLIPFESFETPHSKGIKFDSKKVGNLLLHTYGLQEKEKTSSVSLSIASDGHKVTNNILQVIAGIKMNDISAICALTRKRVLPQTQNICWPLLMVMVQENEHMYKAYIKPLHAWWEVASETND